MGRSIRLLAGKIDRGAGSHVYHMELAKRLRARGHEVSLVCFGPNAQADPSVATFQVDLPRYETRRLVWRAAAWFRHRACSSAIRRLPLPPTDVVIAGEHLFMRAHARRFPGVPWFYLPHSLVVPKEIESYNLPPMMEAITKRTYTGLQRWALGAATRTVRFTEQACAALTDFYGPSTRPRFFVNPMGVELPLVDKQHHGSDGRMRLLWVGQLIPRKRIEAALKALATLRGQPWVFDVVGDGVSRPELERMVKDLSLSGQVVFHGFQQDPTRYYRAADLLVFPSWFENCPVTIMEAMSWAVPCLAMRPDGKNFFNANLELIDSGINGFLARDDDDFSTCLAALTSDAARVRRVGEAARATIERKHTWHAHLDRYERAFDQLVDGR